MSQGTDEMLDAHTLFRWDVLCDAAFEDHQGIWEPYYWLNGGGRERYARRLNRHERQVAAERALRELWEAGLIRFFRVTPAKGINASAEDPTAAIPDSDVPGLLTSRWWRRIPLPYGDVWFTTTARGEAFANELAPQLERYHDGFAHPDGLDRAPDTSTARRHLEQGRPSQARDSLTGLLSHHGGAYDDVNEVLTLLGICDVALGNLVSAGKFWSLTDVEGEQFDRALGAFERRYGSSPYLLWRQVARTTWGRTLPSVAANRVRVWANWPHPAQKPWSWSNVYARPPRSSDFEWLEQLTRSWQGRWLYCRPIAHELRGSAHDRWVRFHSLPKSKRYAENDAERREILRRHHALLDALRGDETDLVVFTCAWGDSAEPPEKPYVETPLDRPLHWTSVLREVDDDDGDEYWSHIFVSRAPVDRLDALLREVAIGRTADVMIAPGDLRWLYHPYDGGADVLAPSPGERDALTSHFADWLSWTASGL